MYFLLFFEPQNWLTECAIKLPRQNCIRPTPKITQPIIEMDIFHNDKQSNPGLTILAIYFVSLSGQTYLLFMFLPRLISIFSLFLKRTSSVIYNLKGQVTINLKL